MKTIYTKRVNNTRTTVDVHTVLLQKGRYHTVHGIVRQDTLQGDTLNLTHASPPLYRLLSPMPFTGSLRINTQAYIHHSILCLHGANRTITAWLPEKRSRVTLLPYNGVVYYLLNGELVSTGRALNCSRVGAARIIRPVKNLFNAFKIASKPTVSFAEVANFYAKEAKNASLN